MYEALCNVRPDGYYITNGRRDTFIIPPEGTKAHLYPRVSVGSRYKTQKFVYAYSANNVH